CSLGILFPGELSYLRPRGYSDPLRAKAKDSLIKETLQCHPAKQGVLQSKWVGETPRPPV
ncbi:MAG TPA: hypothetical protein PK590_06615, partial [Candidatus Omnitrophota bacterium]|nr:hypothetical protein [Candidatus Omnitrophota bacterium]